MKTLVAPKHDAGPHENGFDGCHGRWAEEGMCPGVKAARWLNGLGEDDDVYLKYTKFRERDVTVGEVRTNWLRSYDHIVALEPERAQVLERKIAALKELRRANRRLKQLGEVQVVS